MGLEGICVPKHVAKLRREGLEGKSWRIDSHRRRGEISLKADKSITFVQGWGLLKSDAGLIQAEMPVPLWW